MSFSLSSCPDSSKSSSFSSSVSVSSADSPSSWGFMRSRTFAALDAVLPEDELDVCMCIASLSLSRFAFEELALEGAAGVPEPDAVSSPATVDKAGLGGLQRFFFGVKPKVGGDALRWRVDRFGVEEEAAFPRVP